MFRRNQLLPSYRHWIWFRWVAKWLREGNVSILQKVCRDVPSHNYEREEGMYHQHAPAQNSIAPTMDPSRFPRTCEQAYCLHGVYLVCSLDCFRTHFLSLNKVSAISSLAFNALYTKINLNDIYRPSSYRAVNNSISVIKISQLI